MLDRPNPYNLPADLAEEFARRRKRSARLGSLLASAAFGFVGLFCARLALMGFAFSTLVNPKIQGRDWWRIVADRFLFDGGAWTILIVGVILFAAIFGILASLLLLSCAWMRWPSWRWSLAASSLGSVLATPAIVGLLLFLRT